MSETSKTPALEIAVRTDPGRDPDKHVNEDAAVHAETKHGFLAVVCDGMGGHAGGKEASELAVKTILEIVSGAPEATKPRDALKVAIEEANRRVFSMATSENGLRPGSTVVALLAHAGGAEIAHVGDSRIYLVHGGAISQITKDHSMVQEMVDRNLIRAEDAATHPDANKIMRALGIARDVEVDLRAEPIAFCAGDIFVLCTDGLSDLVGPGEILDVAGSHPPAQASGQLVDLANARGGHDNVTAMILRMKTTATPGDAPTLVKTMQLTQADAPAGPRGTRLEAPAPGAVHAPQAQASSPTLPLAPPVNAPAPVPMPAAIPPGPPPLSVPARSAGLPLAIGLGVAAVALIVAALLAWTLGGRRHVSVPVVDRPTDAAPATSAEREEEEDAGPVPELTPAPPLGSVAPSPAATPLATPRPTPTPPNGDIPSCVAARAARKRGSPTAPTLESQCRAQGGVP